MALALQASLLIRHAPTAVADAFCASRLEPRTAMNYGNLPSGTDAASAAPVRPPSECPTTSCGADVHARMPVATSGARFAAV